MIRPNKNLADALTAAKKVAQEGVIKHTELDSKQIEILKRAGCLTSVIRGWYLLTKPEASGTTTVWYVGFWPFIRNYLLDRFDKQGYCLNADASLDLHTGEGHIARQITVITKKASNQVIDLPQDTSIALYSDPKKFPETITKVNGIYVMPLPIALCRLSPSYFKNKPLNVEIALKLLQSVSEVSRFLLEQELVTDAGRIAGAFRAIGEPDKADQIIKDMQAAGHAVVETNPFEGHVPVLGQAKLVSPYAGRIEAMWKKMRSIVIETFPAPKRIKSSEEKKVVRVLKELYTQDAYHSLSIEGYEVTEELIHKIADGNWNPDGDPKDQEELNAMAVKGYHDAFQIVLRSVSKVILGKDPGSVFESDLQNWYRALFSPLVQINMLKASDLAGYRNGPVYIKGARHVPPNKDAVLDSMETLFKLINEEEHPAVRAVLGHFIFVYIHPYMDGNGRIARFLLNLMLISGGYAWTVIRASGRPEYMQSLEQASTEGKIERFAKFIRSELDYWDAYADKLELSENGKKK